MSIVRPSGRGRPGLIVRLGIAVWLALWVPVGVVRAETGTEAPAATETLTPLAEALQLDALFGVLREEGLSYGRDLEADWFNGHGGARWAETVEAIYDAERLRGGFDAALNAELAGDPETTAAVVDFFGSELGRRVLGLEVDARRAFLDTAQEEAARVAIDTRRAARDPRLDLLARFIAAGDLIEMNVAGSLTGNLAFLTGMSDSGAYGAAMPRQEMVAQTWAQEAQIRDDTTSWLYAYLGLAYDPLSDADLLAYVEFMESPEGRRLNKALFVAFDQVFRRVSYELGHAAGQAMQGQDI